MDNYDFPKTNQLFISNVNNVDKGNKYNDKEEFES
jgi:hypothetical protein